MNIVVALKKWRTKKCKAGQSLYKIRHCSKCNLYYINREIYSAHTSCWDAISESDLRNGIEAEAKKRQEILQIQIASQKQTQARLHNKQLIREKRITQPQETIRENLLRNKSVEEERQLPKDRIELKDFVVRRTTFRCLHQHHQLQNIDADVGIIDRHGNIAQTKASAGYCPECDIFFIMESTYQNLKMKGTPMCRVSDEKTYTSKGGMANGMHLSQESILMQYGYTVSQVEGLSDTRRRKILAFLVDCRVLTRSDVIGYLDFFISQRKRQHQYERAIDKWRSDRDFIAHYKTGSYTEYKISSIYRRS